jgi:hypothetical protein
MLLSEQTAPPKPDSPVHFIDTCLLDSPVAAMAYLWTMPRSDVVPVLEHCQQLDFALRYASIKTLVVERGIPPCDVLFASTDSLLGMVGDDDADDRDERLQ